MRAPRTTQAATRRRAAARNAGRAAAHAVCGRHISLSLSPSAAVLRPTDWRNSAASAVTLNLPSWSAMKGIACPSAGMVTQPAPLPGCPGAPPCAFREQSKLWSAPMGILRARPCGRIPAQCPAGNAAPAAAVPCQPALLERPARGASGAPGAFALPNVVRTRACACAVLAAPAACRDRGGMAGPRVPTSAGRCAELRRPKALPAATPPARLPPPLPRSLAAADAPFKLLVEPRCQHLHRVR